MPPLSRKDSKDIKDLTTSIQKNIDSLYKNTYYNEPTGNKELDNLVANINSNIDRIVRHNMSTVGVPSVSKLYARLDLDNKLKTNVSGYTSSGLDSLFTDVAGFEDFYANFMQNRYLRELDDEIDAVCKYFPDLLEALEIKKEGVLSADHFSKDFLTITSTGSFIDDATFSERCKDLKKNYDLLTFIDEVYDNASKYGEQFIYVVPYSTALSRLLTNKPNAIDAGMVPPIQESAIGEGSEEYILNLSNKGFTINSTDEVVYSHNGKILTETFVIDKDGNKTSMPPTSSMQPIIQDNSTFNMKIELCRSGIIESFVRDTQVGYKNKNKMSQSMSEAFRESVINEAGDKKLVIVKKDKKSGELSINGLEDTMNSISSDGLVSNDPYKTKEEHKEVKVSVPGCVIAKPRRENVIPVYMGTNNSCLGYYYLEFTGTSDNMDDAFQGFTNVMSDTLTTLRGSNSGVNAPFNNIEGSRQEEMIRYIAAQLSNFINKEFVQNNQDLREEIYMILKYNDLFNTPSMNKMRITFVPPEDMIHVYFKMDKITHRGISDLDKAMVPAKIYATMYITDAIAHMVRGQDKRVFYVKQQVEQNIAKTLMNTIQQLKQGNFGLRQFQSINNVLNITGKFNDYIVPTSASGDSPLQIDVIPGQQFTDNTEQMQQLKEMAVNATDVPFELIQTRQSIDYAMQLSMSNSKFLRKVFKRQSLFQVFLSTFITKLYNYEFKENVELEVQLPPPMFITMTNTNQLVDNTKNFIQSITELELASEPDENVKTIYQDMLFRYYIGSHVDLSKHEAILKRAQAEAKIKQNNEE